MKNFLAIITAVMAHYAIAQNLPSQMYFSENEHIIYSGGAESKGLYNESKIREFRLYFTQTDFWAQLKANKQSAKNILAMLIVDGDTFPNVGVRFKGNTSYNAVRNSDKFSFNITMDEVDQTQDLKGYSTINLNNCFEDGSMMREYSYLHLIRNHIPAAQASYVKLYINDVSWGIYPNVQQINKTFAKEWWYNNDGILWRADIPPGTNGGMGGAGWGDGTAALNYLGADTNLYKKYYTLKNSEILEPWSKLVTVCSVLNNTPLAQLEEKIKPVLDLDRTLWYLASEIAFSDDDSYVFKGRMDYYLYYDVVTGKMTPQEFDGNSALATKLNNWSPFYNAEKVNYPLLNKLLQVPSIRQRYIAHMKTIIAEEMDTVKFNALIRKTDVLIGTEVLADTKKLFTNAQYSSEKIALMNFVQQHKITMLSNSEMKAESPTISNVELISNSLVWASPTAFETTKVTGHVSHPNGIKAVRCYYAEGLTNEFQIALMYDDATHDDVLASDGIFTVSLPGYEAGSYVRFYLEAEANNSAKTLAYSPVGAEHNLYYYQVKPSSSIQRTVSINEIMASNSNTVTDEAGEFDDWIELYNNTTQEIDLSNAYLTDDQTNITKWSFPADTKIKADGYLIVWCDENKMQGKYHSNFKISADGESIWLLDKDKVLLDSVSFTNQVKDMGYARVPNGIGNFIIQKPSYDRNNSVLAVENSNLDNEFEVYPNPAHQNFIVRNRRESEITIYDLVGNKVYAEHLQDKLIINASNWSAGIYIIKSNGQTKKLILH
ncbi:MAG: CotH kinase family protein [Saprospiraceae bacterium]